MFNIRSCVSAIELYEFRTLSQKNQKHLVQGSPREKEKVGEEEFPRRATRWSHHHETTSWMVPWMDLGRNPAGVQSKYKSTFVPWDTHYSSVKNAEIERR